MNQEQVLNIVKMRGPLIPSQISKDLGTNILLASAILSEFASRNLVKVSNIKIGGSPLYYVPGQEEKLTSYMGRLPEKEKLACSMLQEASVLRDASLEPVIRVALRQCRDFAKPLEVTVDGQKEIFWKWYLIDNQQAEPIIKKQLGLIEQKIAEQRKTEQVQKASPQVIYQQEKPKPTAITGGLSAVTSIQKPEIKEQIQAQTAVEKEAKSTKPVLKPKQAESFTEALSGFFKKKSITIIEEQTVKKDSEMVYLVKVPSAVGELTYLCIAKNKAKCSEADISYAYVQGQIKKLPVLFLTTGELTKKAKELMQSSEFSNLTYSKV